MIVALLMVVVLAASILFHIFSPWRSTLIASNWGSIDDTMLITIWIAGAGFSAVVLFMAFCLFRFRHKEGRKAAYEPENQKLEAWLAAGTTIAVVALLAPGLLVWDKYITPPAGALEFEAMGMQWQWSFRFPGADKHLGSTDVVFVDANNPMGVNPKDPRGQDDLLVTNGELHLPVGKPIKVLLRSLDVLHDFYVPQIRAKMDLVPGMVTSFWFTPTRTGEFEILCSAFCGVGHPQMRGKMVVDSEKDFETWLAAQQTFEQSRKSQSTSDRRTAAK